MDSKDPAQDMQNLQKYILICNKLSEKKPIYAIYKALLKRKI